MQSLRSEIRAILQEELALLRSSSQAVLESVHIESSADLNEFVQDLLERAASGDMVDRIKNGQLKFVLAKGQYSMENSTAAQQSRPIVSQAAPKPIPTVDKNLITERDIIALDESTHLLTLRKQSRLTPLASDEANRRGIRIVRIEQ